MRSTLIAVLWLAPSMALAQTATPDDLFGPANPRAKGPPTTYQSVFGQLPSDPEATSWRASNDDVGRLGGHVGQLRESDRPSASASPDSLGAADAAASPRTHNHDHK